MMLGANISFNIDKRGESELTFEKLLLFIFSCCISVYYLIVDKGD